MAIDTIVFDFGGVLVDWNPRYVYRQIFDGDEEKMEWFLANICTDDWNVQQDKGRTLAEGTAFLKQQHPEHADLIDNYYGRWTEMLREEITGTVEILHELKKKYKMYGLTNWSAETFPVALQRFDFFKVFDGILVSGEEKLIKPDAAIFELLIKRYDLTPEASLFIDDNKKNIAAADALGFKTIHFTTPEALREKLVALKVL